MSDLYYNNRPVRHGGISSKKKLRRSQRQRNFFVFTALLVLLLIIAGTAYGIVRYRRYYREVRVPEIRVEKMLELEEETSSSLETPDWISKEFIEINGHGRTGEQLTALRDIVIHYTGNPGTTAEQNHSYYNTPDTGVSSHFLVGMDGRIIQCVPLNEISQASNHRNSDTISIEVCHPDDTGEFTEASNDALIRLTAWLLDVNELDETHVIRHYDITGKECPRYHVRNEDAWFALINAIRSYRASYH